MNTQNTDLQADDIVADTSGDIAADTSGDATGTSGDAAEVTDISETPAHADVTDAAEIDAAIEEPAAEAIADDTAESDDTAITPAPPAMRIVRIQDCASLSGRSTLTYHIGCSVAVEDASVASVASTASETFPEPHLRIFANTAKGYFCKDWISLTLLDMLLSETESFASSTVQRMFFEGKSVNSGGFVLAALRNEGLIRTIPGTLRAYERLDPAAWQQEILALIEAGVSLSENAESIAATPAVVASAGKKPSGKARPVAAVVAVAQVAPIGRIAPVARSSKKASKKTAA